MFQIGMFSKINHITIKTLRHYDKIDLLKPDYIDDFTGYRYYSSSQLPKLHKILSLKEMGLSLMEIKDVLNNEKNIDEYLKLRQETLLEEMIDIKSKLLKIDNYLKDEREKISPIVKPLDEIIIASMKITVPSLDIYYDIVPSMEMEMKKQGAKCTNPKYCFLVYPDGEYKEKDITLEVCEAVVDFCEDSEMVKYKRLSKVDNAVSVLHKGSYEYLRETYILAYEWIDHNGYKPVGLPRESYIDGIWNVDSMEDWLTEIQIPILK